MPRQTKIQARAVVPLAWEWQNNAREDPEESHFNDFWFIWKDLSKKAGHHHLGRKTPPVWHGPNIQNPAWLRQSEQRIIVCERRPGQLKTWDIRQQGWKWGEISSHRVVEEWNKIPSSIENGFLSDSFKDRYKKHRADMVVTTWKPPGTGERSIGVDYTWTKTLPERPHLGHWGVYLQVYTQYTQSRQVNLEN